LGYIFTREKKLKDKIIAILFSSGVQAMILYRLSHVISKNPVLSKLHIHTFFYRLNQFINNVDIDPNAEIGKDFLMPHPMGIVIGETTKIGNNVTMMQNVTVGTRTLGQKGKRHATINDGVFIGPNVCILGDIVIGKNASIGANSVVLSSVEANQKITGLHK